MGGAGSLGFCCGIRTVEGNPPASLEPDLPTQGRGALACAHQRPGNYCQQPSLIFRLNFHATGDSAAGHLSR